MENKNKAFVANHHSYTLTLPERHRVPIDKYNLLPLQLLHNGIVDESAFFVPEKIEVSLLEEAHDPTYLHRALNLNLSPKEARRIGYPYDQNLIDRELRIVNGTLRSAEIALENKISFNVAGGTHHAGSNWGEGFCLFNDVAVATKHLIKNKGINRVLIIDLDVHQGNGTAEILQNEPKAFTFSMHGEKNFPFVKEHSDWDIGLEDEMEGEQYLSILEESLSKLFRNEKPEFVFYLAGADVLWNDKLGRLHLTKEDCKLRDRLVFSYCKEYEVPVQVGTAGGYSKRIGDIVDVHAQTFEEGINTILY